MTTRRDTLNLLGGALLAGCAMMRNRMRDRVATHVDRGEIPGAVTLVSRRGEVEVETIGVTSFGGTTPMRRDTIFRVSSMTKPISAVAAMMLVEEGKLRLDEPVDRILPELANRRVLKRLDGPLDDTVPARRAITLRDLITLRMGFGIVLGPGGFAPIPIVKAAEDLQLGAFGPPRPLVPPAPDEWMRRFSTLPLMAQPGEKWMYNTGFEVLGVLLARASGKPLETLYRERVFEPLGMKDTSFSVPASKLDRFTTSYWMDKQVYDGIENSQWGRPPPFPSASAGLVSTVDDFLAFGRMKGLLSPASIEAMTTDQITPEQKAISPFFPDFWTGRGWGFGVSINTRRPGTPGGFGWDGGLGTSWATDPKEDLVAILMTQGAGPPQMSSTYADFWDTVYPS